MASGNGGQTAFVTRGETRMNQIIPMSESVANGARRSRLAIIHPSALTFFNPKGIASVSPGLARGAPTLGAHRKRFFNPNGVASSTCGTTMQPLQGGPRFVRLTQGSSRTRNPGLMDGIPSGFKDGRQKMWLMTWRPRRFNLRWASLRRFFSASRLEMLMRAELRAPFAPPVNRPALRD